MTSSPSHDQRPAKPAVPPGVRVYAIGDSHGCVARMRALHAAILDDGLAKAEAGSDASRRVAVYLGDYVDRGPRSRQLIDLLLDEPLPGFEAVHLMGNHEAMMLEVLDGRRGAATWLLNGGEATLRSYGIDLADLADDGLAGIGRALAERLPPRHEAFLRGLRLSHVEGAYAFVHAGIRPGVALEAQAADDVLWIREPFLTSRADHGRVVVHGHTPSDAPQVRDNRIGIDTGAVYGGSLTALVLEGAARRFLRV